MYIVSAIVTIVFEVAFGTVDFLGVGARLEARGEKPIFRPPDIRDMSFAPLLNVMCLNFPSFSSIYILQIIDILTYDQCSKRKCYLRVLGRLDFHGILARILYTLEIRNPKSLMASFSFPVDYYYNTQHVSVKCEGPAHRDNLLPSLCSPARGPDLPKPTLSRALPK